MRTRLPSLYILKWAELGCRDVTIIYESPGEQGVRTRKKRSTLEKAKGKERAATKHGQDYHLPSPGSGRLRREHRR